MKKLLKGKLYLICWVDTFNIIGWREIDEVEAKCKQNKEYINTLGFYFGEKEGYKIFAQQFTDNPEMCNFSNFVCIPNGVIKKIERLDK